MFYPQGLRAKDEFSFYASRFDTKINGSFYRMPAELADAFIAHVEPHVVEHRPPGLPCRHAIAATRLDSALSRTYFNRC